MDVTTTPEWKALAAHFDEIAARHLRDLFAEDPERGMRLTAEGADLTLDYSKQRVTDKTLRLLMAVARAGGVEEHRDAMFSGEHINTTEDRAVLHVALRMPPGTDAGGRRSGRGRRRARRAGEDGRALGAHPQRLLDRCDGEADRRRRQHRHRGL